MEGQTQGHDVCIVSAEFQGRFVLWQSIYIHGEKVCREFAVDVMELIFVPAVIFFEVILIHLFKVVEIAGAFGIDTLVDDKVFPDFFWNEGIPTVWASQFYRRETAFHRRESGIVYLAEDLAFGAVVPVEVWHGRVTAWAGAGLRDIAFRAAVHRSGFLSVAFFEIGDKLLVSPALAEISDKRERIDLELLVFWGMGIIKGPLFEGDVSADKAD